MRYILVLLVSLLPLRFSAQIITAGQQLINGYYFDIIPDTVCNSGGSPFGFQKIYNIDLNDDGIIDFEINPLDGSGQNGAYKRCAIIPKNSNEIALSLTLDSCFGNPSMYPTPPHLAYTYKLAHGFAMNDTINIFGNWIDSTALLSYNHWVIASFNCSGGNFYDNSKYIGVRVFHNQDTLYGWIKIKDLTSTSVTIEEFACNINSTSIQENKSSYFLVYPNPTTTHITIEFKQLFQQIYISILSIKGQEIKKFDFSSKSKFDLDLSELTNGIYYVKVNNGDSVFFTKIIKE
ncbi:MAG: T9SS type A sorting domain-containing protein [Flavobacteriales bacterium]|nr:T9SS type A sorting domain-containing protein [Flavobacteriales bacterium]